MTTSRDYQLSTFSVINIEGLKPQTVPSKVPFIEDILREKNQLFFGVTETWLKRHTQAEVAIDGYKFFRADRTGRIHTRGRYSGGTGLYLRSDIAATSEQLLKFSNGVCEALVTYSQKENLLIAVVYRQPDNTTHRSREAEFGEMINQISTTIESLEGVPEIMVCGDFNLPNISWVERSTTSSNAMHSQLADFENKFFLHQLVNSPTHKAGNILDLVFTNNRNLITNTESHHTSLSDHRHLEMSTHFKSRFSQNHQTVRNFFNVFSSLNFFSEDIDWDQLNTALDINWTTELTDMAPEEKYNHFVSTCENIAAQNVPLKRSAVQSGKPRVPRERRILMRRRTKVNKQLAKHQPPSKRRELVDELVDIELKLQESYKRSSTAQEQKAIAAIKRNPKYFFTYVKKFCKTRPAIGPLLDRAKQFVVDNEGMANILSEQYSSVYSTPRSEPVSPMDFFNTEDASKLIDIEFTEEDFIEAIDEIANNAAAGPDGFPAILLKKCKETLSKPLYLIWRSCFDNSITPVKAKENHTVPIHKGDSTAEAANYRPVALTSHLVKVFEKILRKKIIRHLDANDLLNQTQHGFRAGRSCLSQLIAHYDKILSLLDQGANVDVIYLDFAKAFDKLDFNIALAKLKSLDIDGKVGRWLHSFLTDRSQTVIVNGTKSEPSPVVSGVPQGSVIGPLLFLVLIGDIDKDISHSFLSSFADDTRIGKGIYTTEEASMLQQDLQGVFEWAETNNMLFNSKKFELLRYGNNTELKNATNYKSNTGTQIQEKNTTRDLGVIMSSTADFKTHIKTLAETVRDLSSWILRSFKSRSKTVLLQLWKSLVIPRLDYCSQLWNPHHVYLINQLEELQKSFIRNINGFRNKPYQEALEELGLYSLQRRRERYQIIYLWSIIENLVPNIVSPDGANLISVQSSIDARTGRTIRTPHLGQSRYANLRHRSLPFHGARLFNVLPKSIRNLTMCTKNSFKSAIDNHLKYIPDEPLMPHIYSSIQFSPNSILVKHNQRHPHDVAGGQ